MNRRPFSSEPFARYIRCRKYHASRRTRLSSDASSSRSANDCPHRAFARAHREAAADVLTVPPPSLAARDPFPFGGGDASLEKYLEWRGWDVEETLRERGVEGGDALRSAIGLLSHPLTFPLTLGRHVDRLLEGGARHSHESDSDGVRRLRMCCVGARAECTLPDAFWRELLVATASHPSIAGFKCEYIIDFVGPDVPPRLKSKTISLPNYHEAEQRQEDVRSELTTNFHTATLHEVVLKFLKSPRDAGDDESSERTEKIRRFWNGGFALFNPGLGHPNLQNQWGPTLKFILGTGRPMLITAHSTIDAERDRSLLKKAIGEEGSDAEYGTNPYASRMEFVDPFPSASGSRVHVVRPNHSFSIMQ